MLEEELQNAQAQVAEYEKFKEQLKEFQQELPILEKEYDDKRLELIKNKNLVEIELANYLIKREYENPGIQGKAKTKDQRIAALQEEINNLNAQLAERSPITEESSETQPEPAIMPTPKKTTLANPKKFIQQET